LADRPDARTGGSIRDDDGRDGQARNGIGASGCTGHAIERLPDRLLIGRWCGREIHTHAHHQVGFFLQRHLSDPNVDLWRLRQDLSVGGQDDQSGGDKLFHKILIWQTAA